MKLAAAIAALLAIAACFYTLKVEPIPVVVSFGGYTPDKTLVVPDGGTAPAPRHWL